MAAPSTSTFDTAEWALIAGVWDDAIDEGSAVVQLAHDVVRGEYAKVLTAPPIASLLRSSMDAAGLTSLDDLIPLEDIPGLNAVEMELLCLVAVAASLHAFLQANWTGPSLGTTALDVLGLKDSAVSAGDLNNRAIAELSYRGEPAYHLAQDVAFLRIAQIILSRRHFANLKTVAWWQLRVWTVHLYMLDEPVALPTDLTDSFDTFRKTVLENSGHTERLLGRFILEQGLLDHHLRQDKAAALRFVDAAKATGLQFELTGALGKRTKFQQNELSQLVLLAESKSKGAASTAKPNDSSAEMPTTLELNDDTLLERTQFTSSSASGSSALAHLDPGAQPALDPLDQCVLLAMCLNVRNTSPVHGLTNEQMAPYVSRVIEHPRNWSVHTMALLLRSRLEAGRTRTVERSTLQLQALIDQMPTADSSAAERLLYIHDIPLPSKWQLERELADRMLSLGVVKSALEIYTRLELWEEVVRCHAILEHAEAGVKIVRDLLAGERTEADEVTARARTALENKRPVLDRARQAKLWCLLGDLEPDNAEQHYLRAWSISGETSGRAARALGTLYFSKGDYEKAVPFLEHGARINPLQARTWFLLGCAEMRKEHWEGARDAFAMCVQVDEEDGESWNNLASVYLQLGSSGADSDGEEEANVEGEDEPGRHKLSRQERRYACRLAAFRALREGLKYGYENWRMWTNFMLVSLDIGELHEVVRAMTRIIEERADKDGAACVDQEVLDKLVDGATRSADAGSAEQLNAIPEDAEAGAEAHKTPGSLRARVADLFERTIFPRVSSPQIYKSYARLKAADGAWSDALKAHLDAYRANTVTHGPWETVEQWKTAISEVGATVDVLRDLGSRADGHGSDKWRIQARGLVRTFAARSKDFVDEPEWARVEALQEELKK
ncbi:TPR-like protein [Auricularia subglabra TFB-10046 SS5]|nr:TPR-like protein [Auricularia subglabra TFB-10046 SS5]